MVCSQRNQSPKFLQTPEALVHIPVKLVGFFASRSMGMLDEIGQREVKDIGPAFFKQFDACIKNKKGELCGIHIWERLSYKF